VLIVILAKYDIPYHMVMKLLKGRMRQLINILSQSGAVDYHAISHLMFGSDCQSSNSV